jgi:hypothetical protein
VGHRSDGDTLRIGQATPRQWLEPGKTVAAKNAPTTFGETSFRITANADGTMHVSLTPPTRQRPSKIIVRLRHPKQLSISDVKAIGAAAEFSGEDIVLTNAKSAVEMDVRF